MPALRAAVRRRVGGGETPVAGRRAEAEVQKQIEAWEPSRIGPEVAEELTRLMLAEARRVGMDRLPARPE